MVHGELKEAVIGSRPWLGSDWLRLAVGERRALGRFEDPWRVGALGVGKSAGAGKEYGQGVRAGHDLSAYGAD